MVTHGAVDLNQTRIMCNGRSFFIIHFLNPYLCPINFPLICSINKIYFNSHLILLT